jgi:hypothetical protein
MKAAEQSKYDERTIRNVLNAVPTKYETVRDICATLKIDLDDVQRRLGGESNGGVGIAPKSLGGYSREMYEQYIGDYVTIRPKYADPTVVKCYLTKIYWETAESCLKFEESDRPDMEFAQSGSIYIPPTSHCLYLMTIDKGWVRTIIITQMVRTQMMRGLITSQFNIVGGAYSPVCAPIVYRKRGTEAGNAYGEIAKGHEQYERYIALLKETLLAPFVNFAVPPGCTRLFDEPGGGQVAPPSLSRSETVDRR